MPDSPEDAVPSVSDMNVLTELNSPEPVWLWSPCNTIASHGISVYVTSQESTGVGWKQSQLHGHASCSCRGSWAYKGPYWLNALLSPSLFFFNSLIYFNWRLITLQYCISFCHTLTWISHGFTCVPHPEPPSLLPTHPIPQSYPSAPVLSTLSHASNWDRWSASHMIIYTFQCYPLKSSHPRLRPESKRLFITSVPLLLSRI